MNNIATNQNKLLSIALPTYNRQDFLDFYFKTHVPRFSKYNIAIYISDNCSIDNTLDVIKKWQAIYPFIYVKSLVENVHFDKNVESALNFANSEYIWLMGDSYELPESSLDKMLDILSSNEENYNVIIANLVNSIQNIDEKIYTNANNAFIDLCWMVGCISCNIYHKSMLIEADYGQYSQTEFCHVGFVYDYIAKHNFKLYWAQSVPVVTLKTPVRKSGWGQYFLSITFEKWPALIRRLPLCYSDKEKAEVIRSLSEKGKILHWRAILNVRAQGFLNKETRALYKHEFDNIAPKYFRYFSYCLLFIPPSVCKFILLQVEWLRRKNYKIRHMINPKKII
ncbi:MAG: glycosyltransferase [Pseudomonadota bacterium]